MKKSGMYGIAPSFLNQAYLQKASVLLSPLLAECLPGQTSMSGRYLWVQVSNPRVQLGNPVVHRHKAYSPTGALSVTEGEYFSPSVQLVFLNQFRTWAEKMGAIHCSPNPQ